MLDFQTIQADKGQSLYQPLVGKPPMRTAVEEQQAHVTSRHSISMAAVWMG